MAFYAKHKEDYVEKGGSDEIPTFFDPKDLAMGSYGVHIDKYLGRSPCDGPPGYVFQKVTYSAGAIADETNVAGVYKLCPDHMGYIYHGRSASFTVPASDVSTTQDRIAITKHGFLLNDVVTYTFDEGTTPISTTSGPLVNGQNYFVAGTVNTNNFQISETEGGTPLDIDGSGNDTQVFEFNNEVRINQDGADLSGNTDPTPSGISGEAKLVPGDMILGAILQLVDTRSSDNRTGFVTAGLVSNDSASPDSYGREIASDPSNFVLGSSISGGKSMAAMDLKACSVASPNLSIYKPVTVATASLDLAPAEIGAPINAINVSGISAGSSTQIRFQLHVYALVGARQKTVSHYTQPDPTFTMSCLTRQFTEHPVSMIH
uniref:Uncharacterized protein n=1 Tax=viral metagenome TaxID=1070528 RepID=A0A2V0RIF3_9ZZZZ